MNNIGGGVGSMVNNGSGYMDSGGGGQIVTEIQTRPSTLAFILQKNGPSSLSSMQTIRQMASSVDVSISYTEREIAKCVVIITRTSSDPIGGSSLWGPASASGDPLGQGQRWDLQNFVTLISEKTKVSGSDFWRRVYSCFDTPEFYIGDGRACDAFISIWKLSNPGSGANSTFPIAIFLSKWKNTKGQVSFWKFVTQGPREMLDLVKLSQANILTAESISSSPPSTRAVASGWLHQQWNSLEVLTCLVDIAADERDDSAKQLLDLASRQATELVLLGLCQIRQPWSQLHTEVVYKLISIFLVGHSSSTFVLTRVWTISRQLIVKSMVQLYSQDPSILSRLLDIAQELKALSVIMEEVDGVAGPGGSVNNNYQFVIDLAALAARREYLNLEKWLQERMARDEAFPRYCLEFLHGKLMAAAALKSAGSDAAKPPVIPVSEDAYAIFFRLLHGKLSSQATQQLQQLFAYYREMISMAVKLMPKLSTLAQQLGIDLALTQQQQQQQQIQPGSVPQQPVSTSAFPPDVEEEVNGYYERLYRGELQVAQLLDFLLQKKGSSTGNVRDTEVFECLINNLFDEFRFFHKYPDRELLITGELFGLLIQRQLLDDVVPSAGQPAEVSGGQGKVALALRQVLDSLQRPLGSKMFRFGITALLQFLSRLSEWPQYSSHLLQIQQLKEAHPDVYEVIVKSSKENGEDGQKGKDDGQGNQVQQTQQQQQQQQQQFALKIRSGLDQPDPQTQDKILFILNNLSEQNLGEKGGELERLLQQHSSGTGFQWLSNYLVVKRISIEPNYHQLYAQLLDKLSVKPPVATDLLQQQPVNIGKQLEKNILVETLDSCKQLLQSPSTLQSSNERLLLKNLGSWLGRLTLAKDRPIKHKDLAVKQLLIDGFVERRLIVNIPFVCKVLEQTRESRVFRPPNPWLMAILRLLMELYHFSDLKLNLKFEIEVLCRQLDVELTEIQPTEYLRIIGYEMEMQKKQQQALQAQQQQQQQQQLQHQQHQQHLLQLQGAGNVPIVSFDEQGAMHIANLQQFLNFQSSPQLFQQNSQLKKLVQVAVERAVREIIGPVVERSVSIGIVCCRELVLKDFQHEPREDVLRQAAQLMAQNLCGMLAMVTSKDPFRISLTGHLRLVFQQSGLFASANQAELDSLLAMTVQDNVDLGCAIIYKAAMEKAAVEVDEELSQEYLSRRRMRERGLPFQPPPSANPQPPAVNNPLFDAMLKYKPHHPNVQQFRVYEEFTNTFRQPPPPPQQQPPVPAHISQQQQSLAYQQQPPQLAVDDLPQPQPPNAAAVNPLKQVIGKLSSLLVELSSALARLQQQQQETAISAVASLPNNHEIIQLVRQINLIISQFSTQAGTQRDEMSLWFAQSICLQLFSSSRSATASSPTVETAAPVEVAEKLKQQQLSIEVYLILLERICELSRRVAREFTVWLIYSDEELKYSCDPQVTLALIQSGLLNVLELDAHLAKEMESMKFHCIEYTCKLIHRALTQSSSSATGATGSETGVPLLTANEFYYSLLVLAKLQANGQLPDILFGLVKDLQSQAPGPFFQQQQQLEMPATEAEKEHLILLFDDWVRLVQQQQTENSNGGSSSEELYASTFSQQLMGSGIPVDNVQFSLFLRHAVEVSIDTYYKLRNAPGGAVLGYQVIDALSHLIVHMVCSSPSQHQLDSDAPVQMFSKSLSVICLVCVHMHEVRRDLFDQKPFFRLLAGLLQDLHDDEENNGQKLQNNHQMLYLAFGNALSCLRPARLPAFVFAWLELMSHRLLMPKLLSISATGTTVSPGWKLFHQLLVDILTFLAPFLRHADMSDPIRVLYKGLLRVLLLLLHDFPEFLCEYHHSLCNLIPPSCIQLRNLILSAFPRNMRLPDPFTPNLKVDLLPEINKLPVVHSDYQTPLERHQLLAPLADFLRTRSPLAFLEQLKASLLLPVDDAFVAGTNYDIQLINSLVLFVGIFAIQQMQQQQSKSSNSNNGSSTSNSNSNLASSAPMDIFHRLVTALDAEGRYHFLNAITNQLRYPNSHTHYFSCVLLYLFAEAEEEVVKEQITRVLLERLIVNRPHPWGLLITFIELLKNPRYNFWSHQFTRCAADIERLFESVARSCMIPIVPPSSVAASASSVGTVSAPSTSQSATAAPVSK